MKAASRAVARRLRRAAPQSLPAKVSLVMVIMVLLLAVIGRFATPNSPTALLGIPFSGPGNVGLLGTDALGRDVVSRVLAGGFTVVLLALAATAVGYVFGASAGLIAGFSRTMADPVIMRVLDVLLAFPPILFLLVVATVAGHSLVALTAAVAALHVPGVARIIRSATLEIRGTGYVEAAVARGESTVYVLGHEILPNIRGTVVADAGPRFTVSILLMAAMSYLGLGQRPPASNWALMISENRNGLTQNPWAVLVPALLIALLTVSVNILGESIANARGGRVQG